MSQNMINSPGPFSSILTPHNYAEALRIKMALYWGCIRVIFGLYWGCIRVVLGLYLGYIGVMLGLY